MKRHWEIVLLNLPRGALAAVAVGLSGEEARRTYEDLLPKVEARPYPNIDAVRATIEIMGSRNPKIARLKPQDVVATRFSSAWSKADRFAGNQNNRRDHDFSYQCSH